MFSEPLILSLIADIYDAAADPQHWSVFLKKFAEHTHAEIAQMGYADRTSVDHNLVHIIGADTSHVAAYNAYYAERDPWLLAAVAQGPWVAGTVWAGHQLSPDRELVKTEFYNDFMRPRNMHYGMSGLILQDGSRVATISTVRSKEAGPCEQDEVSFLKALLPHLFRAFGLHGRLQELQSAKQLSLSALDHAPYAIIMMASGKILVANAEAVSLARGRLIALSSSAVRLFRTTDDQTLQALINSCALPHVGKPRGGTMALHRAGKLPLAISVFPIRRESLPPDAAVIFILDPEQHRPAPTELLQRIFGLTAAEARLATMLANGESLRECADQIGVAHSTARTQLLAIFQKTGTSRQSQLVRLLTSLSTLART